MPLRWKANGTNRFGATTHFAKGTAKFTITETNGDGVLRQSGNTVAAGSVTTLKRKAGSLNKA